MSDMPERIWAWAWEVDRHRGQWAEQQEIVGEGIEYVRAACIRSAPTVQPSPDVAALVDVLKYYETQFCEGFCEDMPDRSVVDAGMENDCGGCKARATIAKIKGDDHE